MCGRKNELQIHDTTFETGPVFCGRQSTSGLSFQLVTNDAAPFLRSWVLWQPVNKFRGTILQNRSYSDLTFSLPGLDQGDVPLLLAVLSKKQCKHTLVQALLKD
jgi:hypothetical protein